MREALMNDVAAGIATCRRAAGPFQAELAARIDRSTSWVSAVEQGRRYAENLRDVMAIAAVLKCRVEDLTRRPIDPLANPRRPPGRPDPEPQPGRRPDGGPALGRPGAVRDSAPFLL
jgi:DNA-binding XRE family transcriptional regulator